MICIMASLGQIIFWSMIVLIFTMAGLIFLLLAIAFSGSQGFVNTSTPSLVGNLEQDVILDCKIQTKARQLFSDVSITWQKEGLTGVVYHYQNKADHLQEQNVQFKDRVKLFQEAITAGNASLLLETVKTEDEGVYRCSVTAPGVMGTVKIHLRVAAFSAPDITSSNNSLIADAPRWLPKPDVKWVDQKGVQLDSDTQFMNNSMGNILTVQVTSYLQVRVTEGTYTCIIQNNLVSSVSKATVRGKEVLIKTGFIFNLSPDIVTSYVIIKAFILFWMLVW